MNILGVIPARGGSRRLPGKNMADLGGKPLLEWTMEAACKSTAFSRLVVSTEDAEIGTTALHYGLEWFERPLALCQDDTPSLDVVRHAVGADSYDLIVLLQPTSPFRTPADIWACIDMLEAKGGDAVISVTQPPDTMVFEVGHAGRLRAARQATVVPNGALFLLTGSALAAGLDWWTGVTYAYHMPPERSIDIDTAVDLELARAMILRRAA